MALVISGFLVLKGRGLVDVGGGVEGGGVSGGVGFRGGLLRGVGMFRGVVLLLAVDFAAILHQKLSRFSPDVYSHYETTSGPARVVFPKLQQCKR